VNPVRPPRPLVVLLAAPGGYNREVRIYSALLLIVCLAGCNRANQDKSAVRQGVIEYISGRGLNAASMEITLSAVEFEGSKANATVAFAPKGGNPAQGMSMQYALELKAGKWTVTGRRDPGQHSSTAATPGSPAQTPVANPHASPGATAAPPNMPKPDELPPVNGRK